MPDLSNVGPSGPIKQPEKKEKPPGDQFKVEMEKKKISEVEKVDPDQTKKRKQRGEKKEEETPTENAQARPAHEVTPFSLEEQKRKQRLDELQKGGPGISPIQMTQQGQTPSETQHRDTSSIGHNESTSQTSSHDRPSERPTYQDRPTERTSYKPDLTGPPRERYSQSSSQQSSFDSSRNQWGRDRERSDSVGPPRSKSETQKSSESKSQTDKDKAAAQKEKEEHDKKVRAEEIEGAAPLPKMDAGRVIEELSKEKKKKEEMGVTGPAAPATKGPGGPAPKEPAKGEKLPPVGGVSGPSVQPGALKPAPIPPPAAPKEIGPYARLHPQVQDLFDRMMGLMTVMNLSGITTTTITLNARQFASSVFFGAQIIIREFSTAPKAFNIELSGSPQAMELLQGQTGGMMAAFQAGNYGFRVNRLDTSLLEDKPLFKRKEQASGDQQDTKGEK